MIYVGVCVLSLLLFFLISPYWSARGLTESGITNGTKLFEVRLALICSSIPVMFVSAVRYAVGTDYFNTYTNGYYRVSLGNESDHFEFGFNALIKILSSISPDNPNLLFIITSIIFVGFTFAAIYNLSTNILMSILLLFISRYYFISMNGVRQFIAMSIFLFALKYAIEEKIGRYVFWGIIAISFHYSLVIFFPVYFLTRLKLTKEYLAILIGLVLVVVIDNGRILYSLLLSVSTKYYGLTQRYQIAGTKFIVFTVAFNAVLMCIYYRYYNQSKENKVYRLFLNIQFIAFLLSLLLGTLPQVERVYWIFSFPMILSLPYMLRNIQNKAIRYSITIILFLVLTAYCVYDISILKDHQVLPYQWIL